jgi:hypothetical protein
MKNILRTLFVVCAITMPFYIQSMHYIGLKTLLRRVGTVFGVGVTTVPYYIMSGIHAYVYTQDAILLIKKGHPEIKFRKPTVEEDYFLRRNAGLKDSTQVYIAKDTHFKNGFSGVSFNDTIAISERLPGFQKTLAQAIHERDGAYASCYIAVAQHEEGHNTALHSWKVMIFNTVMPPVETISMAKVAQKLVPYNPLASLGIHLVRCAAKMVGGLLLSQAHLKALCTYKKYQEFQADQYITPKHRFAAARTLVMIDYAHKIIKQSDPIPKKAAWLEWILEDHPPINKRIAALGLTEAEHHNIERAIFLSSEREDSIPL